MGAKIMRKTLLIMALGLVLVFGLALQAAAVTVPPTTTFIHSVLSSGNSAITAVSTGPWAELDVTVDGNTGVAHFDLEALGNFALMDRFGINLNLPDTTGIGITNLSFSNEVNPPQSVIATFPPSTPPGSTIDGFGDFNFVLRFQQGGSNRFGDVEFDLTGATFANAQSVLADNGNGFEDAAGIWTPVMVGGSFVTGFAAEPIPLPPSALLFGSGLLGLLGLGWRQKLGL
jgi:hypothetical protein